MEDWIPNFGVQIVFEALAPTKTEFCEIPLLPPPRRAGRKKHILEHNSAPNYLTMTKFHIGQLDLNTKNHFSATLKFSILRGGKVRKHFKKFG